MKKLLVLCWRQLNILIHRYLILSFISFILSYKFIFKDIEQFNECRFWCVIAVLTFIAFFFGKSGALQSSFIYIGFLVSVLFCENDKTIDFSINIYSEKAIILSLVLLLVYELQLILKYVGDRQVKKSDHLMKQGDLYPGREKDYKEISKYLSNHSILAIDSPYGNGKSSIVEALRREKEQEWEFINFGILSTTVENVEFCIVREINRLLESHGIFSNPISKIKSLFSHDFSYCVGEMLFENQSYEDQIKNFVADISSLGKVVVLNFEDIDRITNPEHLNKMFSICDTLLKYESKNGEKYIKIIYQCNVKKLQELFGGEDKRYVDKYIPYSVSLSNLLGDFFQFVLNINRQKYKTIQNINFGFLSKGCNSVLLNRRLPLAINGHTARDVERVLDKVNFAFETCEFLSIQESNHIEATVYFFIMQEYFQNVYDALKKNTLLLDQKLFHYYDKAILSGSIESLKEIWNRIRMGFLPEEIDFTKKNGNLSNLINKFFGESDNKRAKDNIDTLFLLLALGIPDDERVLSQTDVNTEKEYIFMRLLQAYKKNDVG